MLIRIGYKAILKLNDESVPKKNVLELYYSNLISGLGELDLSGVVGPRLSHSSVG